MSSYKLADIWVKPFTNSVAKYGRMITKEALSFSVVDDIYSLFDIKARSNTYRNIYRNILFPSENMKYLLYYLEDHHIVSQRVLSDIYIDNIDFTDYDDRKFYSNVKKLAMVDLIKSELLPYVTPKPVTLFSINSSDENIGKKTVLHRDWIIQNYYEADRIKWTQREESKLEKITAEDNAEQMFQTGKKLQEKWQQTKQININQRPEVKRKYCLRCSAFEADHSCQEPKWVYKEIENLVTE